ncbi:putative nuclear pore complex protein an-nup82 [Diaporthe ampelina]|uniref:Putative nuclear pore complex protein an-nup82 n=1 Tax=Diaporthe ampelina TaxID=1214573 RepID=A0A0G2FGQ7_9PEZI|nr:putative nuclear pore complex protein an-nup82 [Diaporthe ampelina]
MSNIKVKSYTPGWLSKPAPGHTLFKATSEDLDASVFSPYSSNKKARPGPRRTIARRGTEVFVAVNREIRWGDLVYLKESWAEMGASTRIKREDSNGSFSIYDETRNGTEGSDSRPAEGYRIIKSPVADEIRQIVVSPNSNYLAVLTAHTVHICVLPDSSHLTAPDSTPLKPRFFTLGPTTHVTSKSAVMSAIWHPLGVKGTSLVTVTEDAVVRVWEVSPADRWSFDAPTLSVDLKKLANGVTLDQDFTASTTATNTSFSPDMFDMEVAAASFAARGSGLWSSMTLYIAMRGGDVYALCPLLPELWAPTPTLIPSLSVSIVAKLAAIQDDPEVSPQDKLLAQQQLEWMSDLDNQEPKIIQDTLGEPPIEVYRRPTHPGLIPRLQGPFNFDMDPNEEEQDDLDMELSDIYVIGQKMDTDDLMLGEDEVLELDENEQEGLSLTVICLLSTSGQVRICLDLNGVEAKWLPPRVKSKAGVLTDVEDLPSLLTYETLDVLALSEVTPECWPVFSGDATSRYCFFITHNSGITHVSLSPWVFRLESELNADSEAGSDFRIGLIASGKSAFARIYVERPPGNSLAACVAIRDADLGYFVLSATPSDPLALQLETPEDELPPIKSSSSPTPFYEPTPEQKVPIEIFTPRPAYQPSAVFDQSSNLHKMQQLLMTSRHVALMQQQIRLSPATLKVFSNAHQIISTESGRLNEAVSELFRRCDALRTELKEQLVKANELKSRIDRVTGGDEGTDSDDTRLTRAVFARRKKQEELVQRFENLRKKVQQKTPRELSDKEKAWVEEVKTVEQSLSESGESDKGAVVVAGTPKTQRPVDRIREIRSLKDELAGQVAGLEGKDRAGDGNLESSPASSVVSLRIPSELRKAKVSQVRSLLDRETALVDALQDRLERLSVG